VGGAVRGTSQCCSIRCSAVARTASVQLVGVYLVFATLILPRSLCAR